MAERTEAKITRRDIVVIDEVGENEYGALTWTDKAGKEYKVKQERRKYFDEIIKPNLAVELRFSEYKGNEYVYSAKLVSDLMPPPPSEALEHKIEASKKETPSELLKQAIAPQEKGLWIKELGEMIRSNTFKKDTELGKVARAFYLAEMSRVLGFSSKTALIEILKDWGITAQDMDSPLKSE